MQRLSYGQPKSEKLRFSFGYSLGLHYLCSLENKVLTLWKNLAACNHIKKC